MNEESIYNHILETLQEATSQNPQVLKPAEERLVQWKTTPGFYRFLVEILKNRSLDINVRWLATLCLKNGVEKYWRKGAPNGIGEEEKQSIRQLLLSDFLEPFPQIELQLAVVVSKIGRFDWPKEWPELIPTLLVAVQNKDEKTQDGALLTWQHVTKTLSSKRLAGDRRLFQELTRDLFPFMNDLYTDRLKCFLTESTDNRNLRHCLMYVKILRKLLLLGFKRPQDSPHVVQFVSDIFPQIKTILPLQNYECIDKTLLHKYLINLCKVLLEFHEFNPLSFIPFLKPTLEFCVSLLFPHANDNAGELASLFKACDKCVLITLNLLKNIFVCAEYNSPMKNFNARPGDEAHEAGSFVKQFFTPYLLELVLLSLLTQYLPLTQQELLNWDEDPEAGSWDEGGESWKFSLRACVETIFMTIFHNHKNVLTPTLIRLLEENKNPVNPEDMDRILLKDALYNAIALAAFDLYDEIDLDQWFQTTLRTEMKIKHNNYRIIRKRVAWLLGNWCNVKFSFHLRPLLYESLLPLMGPDEDLAVRMAACQAFRMCVDDFEFSTEQFLPFVGTYFDALYKLLCDVKECDTKIKVLSVCSFFIERMGPLIADLADDIFNTLPTLWSQSSEHNLLKCAIVTTLTQMTVSAAKVHPITPQVIRHCVDTQQEHFLYMVEDGLALWLAELHQSKTLIPEMKELYPFVLDVIKDSCDNYKVCSKIIRAYILLDPVWFYANNVHSTISVVSYLLPELRLEGFTNLIQIVDLCVKVVPEPPLQSLHPVLTMLIKFLLENDDHIYRQSLLLCLLSRLVLLDQSYFLNLVQESALRMNTSPEQMFATVLDTILAQSHLVTQPEMQKLIGLGLSTLLTLKSEIIWNKFPKIMDRLTEILNDVVTLRTDSDHRYEDFLTMSSADVYEDSEPTEHEQRKRKLTQSDPLYSIHLEQFVQSKLSVLCSHVGAERFASLVSNTDENTVKSLRDFIAI